jgi:hypothetical protein
MRLSIAKQANLLLMAGFWSLASGWPQNYEIRNQLDLSPVN